MLFPGHRLSRRSLGAVRLDEESVFINTRTPRTKLCLNHAPLSRFFVVGNRVGRNGQAHPQKVAHFAATAHGNCGEATRRRMCWPEHPSTLRGVAPRTASWIDLQTCAYREGIDSHFVSCHCRRVLPLSPPRELCPAGAHYHHSCRIGKGCKFAEAATFRFKNSWKKL
jgi:hypothetical protein